ncbi:MAG TPA: Hsp70 family protein, partial [Stackebrandtia sp.]|uniref:Hsp70 family protein n=1 Tax=Stackebrandtia sp. TaxID=2023065 RepID=UPI002D35EB8D
MPSPPQGIAIDFGTSHTVAMLRRGDGRVEPLLFDASPLLPSAVFAAADGGLLVGRDALYSARLAPARLEPHPKRRVDDGTVLLGDRELSIVELFAAVLGRVRRECEQVAGAVPSHVVLTHPAAWGPRRRMVLRDAADRVGFVGPHMIAEPIAAARYYVDGRSTSGSAMLVYDFGGGTLDVSVVTHDGGLAVASMDGHDDLGGVDIDAAIIGHLRRRVGDATAWDELLSPTTAARRRAWRGFVEDVRLAKERLSRASTVDLYVPLVDADLHLTRAELEELAGPMIERGVDVADAVIRDSGVDAARLSAAYLVGGASRMPLVATALHRRLGIAPTATDQLEQVVARGGLAADSAAGEPPAVDPTAPSFASAIGVNGDPTAASAAATPPDLAADHRGLLLDRLHADLRGLVASRSRRRPRVRERPSVDEDAFEFSWSGEESLLGTARWSNGYRATYI